MRRALIQENVSGELAFLTIVDVSQMFKRWVVGFRPGVLDWPSGTFRTNKG